MPFIGGKVPDRWEFYRACHRPIIVENAEVPVLVPFKVPLNRSQFQETVERFKKRSRNPLLDNTLEDSDGRTVSLTDYDYDWFDDNVVENLAKHLHQVPAASRKVGSIINLCLTTRYYDAAEIRSQKVKVFRVPVAGGGTLPTFDEILLMVRVFDSIGMCQGSESVGIHCTHGLNRTGFFCAAYIAVKLNLPPSEAVEKFERARGHVMYRDELKRALDTRVDDLASIRSLTSYDRSKPQRFLIGPIDYSACPLEDMHLALVESIPDDVPVNLCGLMMLHSAVFFPKVNASWMLEATFTGTLHFSVPDVPALRDAVAARPSQEQELSRLRRHLVGRANRDE
ncbi:MAG: uncharacterized protein KVP18_003166 [Porospora cf. gigantea A]|uniref:uncharacterized protein n=1 Tax=Porospora cf. gigantea A TaxID=2853593 RepID=UPI00355A6439|nr:MAG: hypothetical protein KVP18_003166 [Porospora cf. gigantea A]